MSVFPGDASSRQALPPARGGKGSPVAGPAAASARHLTRRAAVGLLAAGAVAVPAALRAPSALAVKGWCKQDPIVKIGDLTVQIVLSSEAAMHGRATGPTQIVIQVPAGVRARFVADDPGFGHHGYDVRFTESPDLIADTRSVGIVIDALVPAADPPGGPLPLVLECFPLGSGPRVAQRAEGVANAWVRLQATFPAFPGSADQPPAEGPNMAARGRKKGKNKNGKNKNGKQQAR